MGDTNTTTTTTKLYQHSSAQEFNAWRLKVKSKARKHGANTYKALQDIDTVKDTDRVKANVDLFDIMVDMIGNDALLNTLQSRYDDKGHEAMQYIQSFWASSTNDHKAEATYDDYEKLHQRVSTVHTTVKEINELFNELSNMREALAGTTRQITASIHSHNMIGMVKRISADHRGEVRHSISMTDIGY